MADGVGADAGGPRRKRITMKEEGKINKRNSHYSGEKMFGTSLNS